MDPVTDIWSDVTLLIINTDVSVCEQHFTVVVNVELVLIQLV